MATAKLTVGQKAQRVLDFLVGLRNARVAAALKRHGFTQADLSEGFALLAALTDNRLDVVVHEGADPKLLRQLDEWENKWFPIASATLGRHLPKVQASLFKNLSQTEGAEVIVSVSTFLKRLEALTKGKNKEGKQARELLQKRGLTAAVEADARALLKQLGTTETPEPEPVVTDEEDARREQALWDWYLEWSEIARTAITQRSLLKQLGFLQAGASEPDASPGEQPKPTA